MLIWNQSMIRCDVNRLLEICKRHADAVNFRSKAIMFRVKVILLK